MPIGTLIRKVSRQPSTTWPKSVGSRPVSQPPRIRPTAAPAPDIAAYTANARLRCGPAGKVVVISASAAGEASAAPRPWRPRAPSSSASLWARPPSSEATAKIDEADHEDPAAAVEVAEPAAEQQQAAEGQGVAGDDPGQVRLGDVEVLPMKGRAMLAMVASSTTISCATEMSTRAHPRCCGWPCAGEVGLAARRWRSVSSDMRVPYCLVVSEVGEAAQGRAGGGQDDLVDHPGDGLLVGGQRPARRCGAGRSRRGPGRAGRGRGRRRSRRGRGPARRRRG